MFKATTSLGSLIANDPQSDFHQQSPHMIELYENYNRKLYMDTHFRLYRSVGNHVASVRVVLCVSQYSAEPAITNETVCGHHWWMCACSRS